MNTIRRYQVLVGTLVVSQLITGVWLAMVLAPGRRIIEQPRRVGTTLPTRPAPAIVASPEPLPE